MPPDPIRSVPAFLAALAALSVLAVTAPPARGDGFPPITDAERATTGIPGEPDPPAVVIFERARLQLLEYPKDMYSQLDVEVRIKVLDERGREMYGEVEIEHSRHRRLSGFKGRTVLPDGREIPVGEGAIFVDTMSRSRKRYVTKAAFPAVEPGAILDYRYTLLWDGFLTFEPWYFANEVPTLHSEITYVVPGNLGARPWGREVAGVTLQSESARASTGRTVRVWALDVPGIPNEPLSFPFEDLSSRFMLVPTEVGGPAGTLPLLKSWDSACDFAHYGYEEMRRSKGDARRLAKELTAGATTPRARAEALYRFVRDEIQHDGFIGVFAGGEDETIDRVLEDRRGGAAEQALLLEEMLDAVGLAPRLVWAGDRLDGRIDLDLPNPWWFERVLVAVDLDGGRVFLDPLDRNLGFGQLAPGFETMPALLYRQRKPEVIELPAAPAADNVRRAEVTLAVDPEGGVAGAGTLTLTGHHAWVDRTLRSLLRAEDPAAVWRKQLEGSFTDYDVTEVALADAVDERRVTVTWKLALRREEVLDDEVTLVPSRPLGPRTQRFALPPDMRRTPVQLPFADVEEVVVTVTWPEGWSIDSAPDSVVRRNAAGGHEQMVELDEAGRTLRYRRKVELLKAEFATGQPYAALREVTAAAEKADAQPLVLSAR